MNITRPVLDKIASECGHSFYLLDVERFRLNFTRLTTAFRTYYKKTTIAYSYKTNYIPRFCGLVNELGGYAEVVSDMEYQIARKVGVERNRIFYNGPYKNPLAMEELLLGGGVVNADSLTDLKSIIETANRFPAQRLRIGLRCNFDVEDGVLSRFGFDVGGEDYLEAKRLIASCPNVMLIGLHCHFAARNIETWINRTKGMLQVIEDHMQTTSSPLEYVSLGGGMYGDMPDVLRAQFSVPIPSFEQYAEVAAKPFADFFAKNPHWGEPELLVEPGTALAADSVKFVAQVIGIKCVRGKTIATLAGSIYNINPTPNRKNLPITVVPTSDMTQDRSIFDSVDFGGYTCIESDYLYKNYHGPLAIGDCVVFDDVGAYSVVMKPPFILPNFAVVEWDAENSVPKIVKRREVFDDLFHTYAF